MITRTSIVSQLPLLCGVVVLLIGSSKPAIAGKPEREKVEELTPAVAAVELKLKEVCGCPVHVTVDWNSFEKAEQMRLIFDTLLSIVTGARTQCDNDDNKKVFCSHVSGFQVTYSIEDPTATLSGTIVTATCEASSYTSDGQISDLLAKF